MCTSHIKAKRIDSVPQKKDFFLIRLDVGGSVGHKQKTTLLRSMALRCEFSVSMFT